MPFPGYPLATNKTNATGQSVDHPAHHNALATAVNDLQGQVDAPIVTADIADGAVTLDKLASDSVDSSKIVNGSILGATDLAPGWTAYSPVITPNGWTLGGAGGSIVGAYSKLGSTVFWYVTLIFGAGMTAHGTNWLEMSLPFSISADFWGARETVNTTVNDVSLGTIISGRGIYSATNTFNPFATPTTGSYATDAAIVSAAPFAWAANDQVYCKGWYRAV